MPALPGAQAKQDREAELAAYQRLAASKRVDAVILHTPTVDDERMDFLRKLKMPFVLHGRGAEGGNFPWIDIDNFGAIYRATSYLIDIGHRRIGLINGVSADLPADTMALAQKIAQKPRGTVKTGKEAFYRQLEMPLAEAYDYAARVMTENMLDAEAREGIGAFIEKREPKWP